MQRTMR